MDALLFGFFVNEDHFRRKRCEFCIEGTCLLSGGGPLLALQRVFVLLLAADVVALGDNLGSLQHRHISVLGLVSDAGALCAEAVAMFVLHQTDGVQACSDHNGHVVIDDLLGGSTDCHHARCALSIYAHARD